MNRKMLLFGCLRITQPKRRLSHSPKLAESCSVDSGAMNPKGS
jgi:hypothetical protein